jgi:hypothetical protein
MGLNSTTAKLHHSTTPPMSTAISSVTSGADAAQTAAAANQTLTQANFLQLLVTQMSSQDPLNPQSDTEFAAQLAQFSALQQSQAMSQNMSVLQANSMIGETVTVTPTKRFDRRSPARSAACRFMSGTPGTRGERPDLTTLSQVTGIAALRPVVQHTPPPALEHH